MKNIARWRGRTVALAAAGALSLASLSACGSDASGDSADSNQLHVYYTALTADYLALWIAEDEGIFSKHGLDVTLSEVEDASGVPALLSGDMQIGATAPTSVLSADAAGSDLTMFATTDPTTPFDMMVTKEIHTIADLKGKNVGVSSAGSGSDFATRVGLQAAGLDPSEVNILPLGSKSNRVAALTSGQIQGGVDNPPTSLDLEKQGLHSLFDMSTMGIVAPNTVYTAQASWLQGHQEQAQAFVDSLVEALNIERTDQDTSVKVLKKYFDSDDTEAMVAAWKYFKKIIPDDPTTDPASFDKLIDFSKDQVAGLADLDVASHIDNSFVQKAVQAK